MRNNNEFLNTVQAGNGNFYGTSLALLNDCIDSGKIPLMDINPGVFELVQNFAPAANFVAVFPPSVCIERDRLAHRGSENVNSMPGRIRGGFMAMNNDSFVRDPILRCVYQTIIVNNDLENSLKLVNKLV